ncbi:hypothetical protein GCM10023189_13960 [Nibrella saemangeumensis]|uniref:SGNH/GDSL hydrolase family protein n=1 Tax=Nibrella saemangeumensis TaxID=1084526 RepID=A0ABP8MMQ1_9BACT
MRKVTKAFLLAGAVLVIAFLLCVFYDRQYGFGDGLIRNFAFRNVFSFIRTVWLVCFLFALGFASRLKWLQNLTLLLFTALFLLFLLELAAQLLVRSGLFPSIAMYPRRYYIEGGLQYRKPLIWGDMNPASGRWRVPNRADTLITCSGDTFVRPTNAFGALDRERSLVNTNPDKPRVVVIGDSFYEGYMVPAKERVSSRLENLTGIEHLNFAINGTSPINYYLLYKSLISRFEHDVVIIGFLPANDFEDYTDKEAYRLVNWPIYRPYWYGQYPNYQLRYSLSDITQSIYRPTVSQAKLLTVIDSVYAHLPLRQQLKAELLANSSLVQILKTVASRRGQTKTSFTSFEQFDEEAFLYAQYSLEQLFKEAKGKQIILLSTPILQDIQAIRDGKQNRLDSRLRALCDQYGVTFIPLLPEFLAYKGDVSEMYVACDGHWSRKGEAFVADLLQKNSLYQRAVSGK